MSRRAPQPPASPPPLRGAPDDVAALLERYRAVAPPASALSPEGILLERGRRLQRRWTATAATLTFAVVGLTLAWSWKAPAPLAATPPELIAAEPVVAAPAQDAPAALALVKALVKAPVKAPGTPRGPALGAPAQHPAVASSPQPPTPAAGPATAPKAASTTHAAQLVHEGDALATPLTAPPSPSAAALPSDSTCAALTREGAFADAVTCYAERSQGDGVGAELALLEKARLENQVLGQPALALRSLATYEDRFARGALHREAHLSKIEILSRLGRTDEARRAIDRLLPAAPERAAELLSLSAQLAARAGDCEAAMSTAARASAAGASDAQLRPVTSLCAADRAATFGGRE